MINISPTAVEKLSPSAKMLFHLLQTKECMCMQDILNEVPYAPRTVRYALNQLKQKSLIRKIPNIHERNKMGV